VWTRQTDIFPPYVACGVRLSYPQQSHLPWAQLEARASAAGARPWLDFQNPRPACVLVIAANSAMAQSVPRIWVKCESCGRTATGGEHNENL